MAKWNFLKPFSNTAKKSAQLGRRLAYLVKMLEMSEIQQMKYDMSQKEAYFNCLLHFF